MKESELRARLQAMYRDIPEDAHQALMQAPRSGEEKTVMKRKLSLTPALAILMVLLLASVAYAVATYSVREMSWANPNDPAYEDHIININQRYENDYMAVTVNDAGFDGQYFAVAMNLESKKEGEYIYVRPKLTAESEGVEYYCSPEGIYNLDFMTGFVYPDVHHPEYNDGRTGYEGSLLSMEDYEMAMPTGPVNWALTLKVYHILYDVVADDTEFTGAEDEAEAYRAKCEEAYRNHQVLVLDDGNLSGYEADIQGATGIPEEEYWDGSYDFPENLVKTGVMEQVDTIVCRFTTNFGDEASQKELIGQKIPLNDAELTIDALNLTFRSITYDFHITAGEGQSMEDLQALKERLNNHWEVRFNGESKGRLMSSGLNIERPEDGGEPYIRLRGQYNIPDTMESTGVRSVTFMPYEGSWEKVDKYLTEYAFTVDVENGKLYPGEAK